ncbi:hypothetical protein [Nesterenkonia sp. HG001]|uniref:hypothetical protein n=1 Tax=Nesterenkonia sp. HG001 TaxID=2983207 RepID=UPI002AC5FD99|nr:hypothetical protein [Nesterenkonia sp. HG001]MDZ5077861.1 hypothetical protein [Nesterenkonia sp. HG001]
MHGVLNVGQDRPAKITLRVGVRSLPSEAEVTVTDVQLQPGATVTGWMPHTTELPWSAGVSEEAGMYPSANLVELDERVRAIEEDGTEDSTARSWAQEAQSTADQVQGEVDGLSSDVSDLQDDVSAVQDQLATVQDELTAMQSRLEAVEEFADRAEEGTGLRDITDLFPNISTNFGIYTERRGPFVALYVVAVDFGEGTYDEADVYPEGFRPSQTYYATVAEGIGSPELGLLTVWLHGRFRVTGPDGQFRLSALWVTEDDWPDTLPGDPA